MEVLELNVDMYKRMIYYHTIMENNYVRLSFSRLPKNLSIEESVNFFNKALKVYLEDFSFCEIEKEQLKEFPQIDEVLQDGISYMLVLEDIHK